MKRVTNAAIAACLMCLTGPSLGSEPKEVVIVNVDGLHPNVAKQVLYYAEKGPWELRRYLDRTNMIHRLRMEDVVRYPESAQDLAAVRERNSPKEVIVVVKAKRD